MNITDIRQEKVISIINKYDKTLEDMMLELAEITWQGMEFTKAFPTGNLRIKIYPAQSID